MEFGEREDEPERNREPPPPEDRVWRHPSEIGPTRHSARRQLWLVGLASALAASILSTGLALVVASLVDSSGGSRSVDTSGVVPSPDLAGAMAEEGTITGRARPAIVQLRFEGRRTGLGVVFRSDGHILANAHVVEGVSSVTVVLASGREVPAKVLGSDPDSDTAVVKIDGGPFPVADLGSSVDLRNGQEAFAAGSSVGVAGPPSVTVGVIVSLHRSVRTRAGRTLVDMIQTNARIVPGSSGGALLDVSGRVIGITTAVALTGTGVDGFGYAIPSDTALWAADQLIATGKVVRAWLGVEASDLDRATAAALNVDGGAIIERVKADSPAEGAGLVAGDVIVGVNGGPVTSMGMLVVSVRAHRPGDVLSLEIVRDNQHRATKVTVTERPPGS